MPRDFPGQQITVLEPSLGGCSFDMQEDPTVGIPAVGLLQPIVLLIRKFTGPGAFHTRQQAECGAT